MKVLYAPLAWLSDGWQSDVRIEIDAGGTIKTVSQGREQPLDERVAGPLLPGMPNLHSHAFQRAMAGLAEEALNPEDSFWTWRELMYRLVGRLTPEQVQAIATHLYIEMLKGGYTSVAEFHYLHHQPGGAPYANLAEMAERIAAAAEASGIGLTLLPTFYAHGGFGGKPLADKQMRFRNDVERYLKLLDGVGRACKRIGADWGLCFHSLRAATEADITAVLAAHPGERPIHIHIAEQTKEVEDCLAWSNRRPVEWLYDKVEIDKRWCLIHATHVTPDEVHMMGHSEVVVGLCPTTEANLGDGIFPFGAFVPYGRWGIGSDSHISVSPTEELRLLEYGQRLTLRERNIAGRPSRGSSGRALWADAAARGAPATGRKLGTLGPGSRADLVVLDDGAPTLYGRREDTLLDALVFAGNANPIRDVMVGGNWVVRDGRHVREGDILTRFKATVDRLMR